MSLKEDVTNSSIKNQILTLFNFQSLDPDSLNEIAPILQAGREQLIVLMTRIPFSAAALLFILYFFSDLAKNHLATILYAILIVVYGFIAFHKSVTFNIKLIATGLLFELAALVDLFNYGVWLFGTLFLFVTCIFALVFGGARKGWFVVFINTGIVFLCCYSIAFDIYIPPITIIDPDSYTLGSSFLFALEFLIASIFSHSMISALLRFLQTALIRERETALALEKQTLALEQASLRKDSFLATMSHELRTPLNSILIRTQAMQMGVYGALDQRQTHTVEGIETSGNHLLSLIDDILNVSKITAGEMKMQFESIDLTAVIQDCIKSIFPLAIKKQISVKTNFNDHRIIIDADALRLRQILFNLLSNAVKFTPDKKAIGIELFANESEETITISVWDEGIGIPESARIDLFEPFIQVDNRLARAYEGTGLGLTLAKQFTELHNGELTVESEVGVGSRFNVTLPIKQTAIVLDQ